MNYGFAKSDNTIRLPPKGDTKIETRTNIEQIARAGQALGFVSREKTAGRKPGPKRTEPQGKLTLTGPKRVLERLQARCDVMGNVPYWKAIEHLLDETKGAGSQ